MDNDPRSLYSPLKGNFPFSGIATFAGYPLWDLSQEFDAVVLGVPYDEGTTYRPGTRFGPRAIRDASMFYSYEAQENRFYDAGRRKWILTGRQIADANDVPIEPLSLEKNRLRIEQKVTAILNSGALPVVMGGDHSITHPVVKAFEGRRFHYVHLDTHIDSDRIFGNKFTHGSPVLQILDEGLAQSITIMGVRGLTNSGHDMTWLEEQDVRIITARELKVQLRQSNWDPFWDGDYYLSLDIDFFDPSVAPGTGTSEPGGLFFNEFSDILYLIAEKGQIIGFDVVEVNPFLDGMGNITAHLAARCMLEILSAALDRS